MTRAEDIEATAALWLVQRQGGNWRAEDEDRFRTWLDESIAHKVAFWRLEHGWEQADRVAALGMDGGLPDSRRTPVWWPVAIAASLLLTIAAGLLVLYQRPYPVNSVAYRTMPGQREVVTLADDSRVEMNTRTAIRTRLTPGLREVWLDRGEAFFSVTRNLGRPFLVHAGNRTVTVLGTRFGVRRSGGDVVVAVQHGRVRLDERQNAEDVARSTTMTDGVVAVARGKTTLVTSSPKRVEDLLAWRDDLMRFDDTSLATVVADFNRYGTRQIVITDPDVAATRIGGTFRPSDPDAFLRLIDDAYGLRVTDDGRQAKISR